MKDRVKSRKATKLKRKSQKCKVFEVKLNNSKLSLHTKKYLSKLFIEAKWFYNYCLSFEDVNNAITTIKEVPVLNKDKEIEIRKFEFLSSQMKQSIKTRIFNSLSGLKALKSKGHKVGKLKFKSRINSIPLKQFNKTYFIKDNKIRIQGMKQWLRVKGLNQIPLYSEIANANLIKKGNDFYLKVTIFNTKENKEIPETTLGIDFGCNTQLTLSNRIKIEYQVPASKRIKRLDHKIMKKDRKDSKKKRQDQVKREKEYLHIKNKKKDIKNKIVNAITDNYKYVCFQDESINAWKAGRHGKKIQNSSIGSIISDLKNKSVIPLLVNKFFPSTKACNECGSINDIKLNDRIFKCKECGYTEDRDIKAAIAIETVGLKQLKNVPLDERDIKTRENLTSAFFNTLNKIDGIKVSKLESVN